MKYFHLSSYNFNDIGHILFIIGIFFIPSSFFLGVLFLLPAGIIGHTLNSKNYFRDNWNLCFFSCGVLIIINSLLQNFFLFNEFKEIWDPNLSLIGLANWIPFFWLFWSLQTFLDSPSKRRSFALALISGTLPVIITGIGQYFFNWTGPFYALNGLIIWYQKPVENPGGLSGLFSNQNYAGSWLNFVWPFCIATILEGTKSIFKKSISLFFLIFIGLSAFLTYSRNAWIGLLITVPIVIGESSIIWLSPILLFVLLIGITLLVNYLSINIFDLIKEFIPEKIYLEFSNKGYEGLDVTRLDILQSAMKIISLRPFIGIGAASFSAIYAYQTGFFKGHSHNLFTELAISYGLPVTILFFSTISCLIFKSAKIIFFENFNNISKNNSIYERAIWASIFFFFLSQMADIQYFDGRISIISWILLISLKKILDQNDINISNVHIN